MSDLPMYRLDRVFDASRDLVWRAWTDPELLPRWYGPNADTIIHKFDLRPGGVWLNEMRWGEKFDLSKMSFLEVEPQEKLVWHHSSTDSDWNVISSPMMPGWPRVLLTTVTFADRRDKTNVCLTQSPVGATEVEITCFTKMMAGMDSGWGSGYAIMDSLLAELQTAS